MRVSYEHIVHYVFHHHISIILAATVLSVASGFFAAKLRIKADSADLLPDDYISVQELNRIKGRVGGIGPLMVIVISDDLGSAVDFMHALADSLEGNPLISSVIRGKNSEFLSKNRLLYMGLDDLQEIHDRIDEHIELQKLKRSPLYFALDDEEEEEGLDFSDLEEKYSDYNLTGFDRDYYLTKEKNGIILRLYPAGVITDRDFTDTLFRSLDRTITAIGPERFHPVSCATTRAATRTPLTNTRWSSRTSGRQHFWPLSAFSFSCPSISGNCCPRCLSSSPF